MDELHDNILMRFSAVIHDPVTTTDELIPSGDTASYRSNPIRLAEYALCRRVPGYAGYCRSIQAVEEERKQGKMPEELVRVMNRFGIDEDMIAGTGYGSCLFANKLGTVCHRASGLLSEGSWRNCQSLFRVCNKEIPQ